MTRPDALAFLDRTLPTLPENLALDEALLLAAEAGGPEVLRFWSWPTAAVVLGAGGRIADDVDEARCVSDGVPIARRSSGGGTVLLGPGCLLYTVVLAFEHAPGLGDLMSSYDYVLQKIAKALDASGAADVKVRSSSDLTIDDRKISGNAQQRKRTHFLHHGSLLHAFDPELATRYLKLPPRQPDYRHQRSHADFLTNLPADPRALTAALRDGWRAEEELHEIPMELVRQLVGEKFGREDWIRRR